MVSFSFFFISFSHCLITSHEIGAQFTFFVPPNSCYKSFLHISRNLNFLKVTRGEIIEDDNANFLRQDLGRMRD